MYKKVMLSLKMLIMECCMSVDVAHDDGTTKAAYVGPMFVKDFFSFCNKDCRNKLAVF
jgi:hypothetical protein